MVLLLSKKRINITIFILFQCLYSIGQDIHFSQFLASPLNLNPSLSGVFDGDYRFVANHRNQWQSITTPYKTFSASFDSKITRFNIPKSYIGLGILLNTDKAGDSEFGTTQIGLSISYHKIISSDSSLIISGGINLYYNQYSINYNNLTFNSQYDGNQYNSNLSHNEVFPNSQISYFDVAGGFNIFYLIPAENTLGDKIPLNTGISFFHINKPEQSFYDVEAIELNRKIIFYVNSKFKIQEELSFLPSFIYMRQGKLKEFDLGGLFKYNIDNIAFHAFYIGGWFRMKDAGIIKIGLDYQNINLGISYDINTSKLSTASNGLGGMELSLKYIFNKTRPFALPYYKQCPTFM